MPYNPRQTRRSTKLAIGCLSLYLNRRLRKAHRYRAPDILLIDIIMAWLIPRPDLRPFAAKGRADYLEATRQTIYWHGTGRFQYDKQGKTTDVLQQIIAQGSLRPYLDAFDFKHGEMVSTSVAKQRMYARIYADMHEYGGAKTGTRYGQPRFWLYYFIMAINLHATKELGLWDPKVRRERHAAWRKHANEVWAIKVNRQPSTSSALFFDNGSDIQDNYPVIIGLKPGAYTLLTTADYIARYECRIGDNIPINAFSHIEVPQAQVAGVTALLRKYGHEALPVFAFEQCEQLQSTKHFSQLVA